MARHDHRVGRALSPVETRRLADRARRHTRRRGPASLGRDVAVLVRALGSGRPAAVALAAGALAYLALVPDAVPDVLPFAGLVDDGAVLAAAVAALRRLGRR